MTTPIYFDYAAATPMDRGVVKAMEPYFFDDFYNPSATYLAARDSKKKLEEIRRRIAMVLGAKPAEVVFTAGATEANNLAIQGVMNQYPEAEVIVSALEHESVLEPARLFTAIEIPANKQGIVRLDELAGLISDKTVLVSVMLVNNELGTVQPIREIAIMLQKIRTNRHLDGNRLPIYLHTDSAQAGNYFDLHVGRLGIDLLSLNGGKIYGPKQSGILYVKAKVALKPLIVGGGQEFGLRSGTENVAAAAGLAYALESAALKRQDEAKRVTKLRELFENDLAQLVLGAVINGSKNRRAPHIISLTIPGVDNERLMMELDERGIQCASGSACSAAREEASHVLSAIWLSPSEARSTLRFSLGRQTEETDIKKAVRVLADLTVTNR